MMSLTGARGAALVVVLLAVGLLSALGLGVVLASSSGRLSGSNHEQSVALVNAAEAALSLASADLALIQDWSTVLDGSVKSSFVDAPAPAVQTMAGTTIDVPGLTNRLTCGSTAWCSDAQISAITAERPWGANNPRWQPFLYIRLDAVYAPAKTPPAYVVVWLGDDARETDGDAAVDGGGADDEGRFVLRARIEAFGTGGARRAVEAELRRVCGDVADLATCLPGIRVQSWHALGASIP
jgi:hypothetical protein